LIDFPEDSSMRISHEAIFQALYVQGRGAMRRELTACLRTGRALRVPRERVRNRGKSFVTPEILISERPACIEDRAVPVHWEGDFILGLESSAIGTLGMGMRREEAARFCAVGMPISSGVMGRGLVLGLQRRCSTKPDYLEVADVSFAATISTVPLAAVGRGTKPLAR
jgi:IS30 family transposase